ncbi:alpha/beta fold hydrolase [Pedobacter sp. ISL-68]|uniref:alpha/beta fold hydrolase n=1 Tax=unclassified Pedobacter TaxID=2628915 RepID=UPI001BE9B318|nr:MULTISPECIES: alpha/beta fold hydrolase [unclassified Pedobacter]MBT2564749.1 alpha/beta fold hydrolase [Pedobacter sp. ISL-64]MBT2593560.1 alpha/beta fold hydrolase [Pedobacter sp. ISL-68]
MKKIILTLLSVATATIMFSSCSKKNLDDMKPAAKNYVLVHGAWQAPYVWDAVKTSLINEGNNVTVVELPGHGSDNTVPSTITLNLYRDKVADALSKINGKVILVGHSLGGMIISAVAEQNPSKIEKLVYLAAYLPTSGQSLFDLAGTDAGSSLGGSVNGQKTLTQNDANGTLEVAQNQIVSIFIQDGSPQVQNLVLKNYRPEPAIPFITPVTLTAANFGSVEKVYIKTLQDHQPLCILSKTRFCGDIVNQNRKIITPEFDNISSMKPSHKLIMGRFF